MPSRLWNINHKPDFGRMLKVLKRDRVPDRVPFFELFSNIEDDVLKAIGKYSEKDTPLQRHITYMYSLGYDYINLNAEGFDFPQIVWKKTMTEEGERGYLLASSHTISNREDFEKYPFPDISKADFSTFEKVKKILPDGMKVMPSSGGILENVMWLLGYEGISFMLFEDPSLVKDMFEAVATRVIEYLDYCASFDIVGAVRFGEDMGHRTQTLLSPEVYRQYLFPWHKKLVEKVHKRGKPIILHSCGNLTDIWADILACGWDAKHSFEDIIEPVWESKAKYGTRIAHLGGFDMDKVCRMTEDEIRKHTRWLIEKCAPGGGWALGTGNSVANYIPINNFLAMLEEGYLAGRYLM